MADGRPAAPDGPSVATVAGPYCGHAQAPNRAPDPAARTDLRPAVREPAKAPQGPGAPDPGKGVARKPAADRAGTRIAAQSGNRPRRSRHRLADRPRAVSLLVHLSPSGRSRAEGADEGGPKRVVVPLTRRRCASSASPRRGEATRTCGSARGNQSGPDIRAAAAGRQLTRSPRRFFRRTPGTAFGRAAAHVRRRRAGRARRGAAGRLSGRCRAARSLARARPRAGIDGRRRGGFWHGARTPLPLVGRGWGWG